MTKENKTSGSESETWRERNKREACEIKGQRKQWIPRNVRTVDDAERAIIGGYRVDSRRLLHDETLFRKTILLRAAHRVHTDHQSMAYLLSVSNTAVKKWIKECGLAEQFFREDRDAALVSMGLGHQIPDDEDFCKYDLDSMTG
ncbi:MAG: hypothetical protein GY854_19980 [Deltaproteobacteria bacterium]|nr:hypothetical protein [Deltaproteobacteria bacterium]